MASRATTVGTHPLVAYVDQIDPAAVYTVRRLAALMEMAEASVRSMATYGWLPGSRMRPHARGGREYTWTGKQLLRIARRPLKVTFDHEKFAPQTLYRVGCRCPACVAAHSADSREWRRTLADEAFPEPLRSQLLTLVEQGAPVAEAARRVGVTVGQVYGRANRDSVFAEALDEAAWALCVMGEGSPLCGTGAGYRGNAGKRQPCRGTGCREWRRGMSQRERAGA